MKDYEQLSKVHFDKQAKVYDRTDTMYYSKYPKISCKHVEQYLKTVEFDSMLDVVTCIQSFHHYPYPEKAMREMFRVLRPGGRYIISDTGYGGIKQAVFNKIFLPCMNSGDYAVYSKENIVQMMKKCGFEPERAEKITAMIYTVVGRKPVNLNSERKKL